MVSERKTTRFNARVPPGLAARVDFVVRNIDSEAVKNRSAAIVAALEAWLPGQETRLRELGILEKAKAR